MADMSYIIAGINCILAIAVFYFARKKETAEDATQAAEVIVEMRNVRRDIGEIKGNIEAMRHEWKADHDTLTGIAREQKAMWRIIDTLKKGEEKT